MPKQYEAIRDSLISRGMDEKAAKSEAAATYNKQHPGAPMGPNTDKKEKAKPKPKKVTRVPRKQTWHD